MEWLVLVLALAFYGFISWLVLISLDKRKKLLPWN